MKIPINNNNNQSKKFNMSEDLPILKGILKGNVNYHNARMYFEVY